MAIKIFNYPARTSQSPQSRIFQSETMVSLKDQRESFVTGHEGTSPQEILLVCCTVPIGSWCGSLLLSRFPIFVQTRPLSLEAFVFWIPMILCQSNLLYPWGLVYLGLEVVIAIILELYHSTSTTSSSDAARNATRTRTTTDQHDKKPMNPGVHQDETKSGFLTTYRSSMLYLTFVAILAVDFRLFPRRFAKTETHGYGLMDLGPASFMIAGGLVSPKAKGKLRKFGARGLYRLVPLLTMGILRLVTHKGIEYQEHASEYGVHWNFFFTLTLLPPLVYLFPGPSWKVPMVFMAAYQWMLTYGGVQEWIEEGPRRCEALVTMPSTGSGMIAAPLCHFLAANREGIFGCIGYASIFMLAEWIGASTLWSASKIGYHGGLWATWSVLVVSWQFLIRLLGIAISRRSTN